MKNLYAKLFDDFNGQFVYKDKEGNPHEMCHFVACKGNKYDMDENKHSRLMIIGRATNGWSHLETKNAGAFGLDAENAFLSDGFAWLDLDSDRGLYTFDKKKNKPYYLRRSAFWRVSEKVWKKLANANSCPRWIDYICWSNLYKIAPESGNPTSKNCVRQYEACKNILIREIEEYKPTHILMVTGIDWLNDKKCNFSQDIFKTKENSIKGSHSRDKEIIVEAIMEYKLNKGSIPVVVTCRPEICNNDDYVKEVIKAFEIH